MSVRKSNSIGIRRTRIIGPSLKETLKRKWIVTSRNLPLAVTHPKIASQWHPKKNGPWTAYDYTKGSQEYVWWQCPHGPDHVWKGMIRRRTGSRHASYGCPFCTGQRPSVTNSVASLYPKVAKQWHRKKNGALTPSNVVSGSKSRVWWECTRGPDHEWSAVVYSRTLRGNGCPFCAGLMASVTNSLGSLFPKLAQQWHPRLNGSLTPSKIVAQSKRVVWWRCNKGSDHTWRASCSNRIRGSGCPSCSGLQFSVTNSLLTRYPEAAKLWHPTKNGTLRPKNVHSGALDVVWWQCRKNPQHEWKQSVTFRAQSSSGCPFCLNRRVCKGNSLADNFPQLAKQWHASKNGELLPSDVVPGSKTMVWWKCSAGSDHVWKEAPIVRTAKGAGCPFCSNHRVSKTNSLKATFPEIAKQWHRSLNGSLTPNDVVGGTYTEVWWKCPKGADHEWQQTVAVRTGGEGGCPFCCSRRLSKTNSLAELFQRLQRSGIPREMAP